MKKLTMCFLLSLMAVGCSSTGVDRLPSSAGGPGSGEPSQEEIKSAQARLTIILTRAMF